MKSNLAAGIHLRDETGVQGYLIRLPMGRKHPLGSRLRWTSFFSTFPAPALVLVILLKLSPSLILVFVNKFKFGPGLALNYKLEIFIYFIIYVSRFWLRNGYIILLKGLQYFFFKKKI